MRSRRIVLAVGLLAILFAIPAAAKGPTGGTSSGACPSAKDLKSFVAASNVGANFTNDAGTNTTTYFFSSLTNENPQDGVPGLVKYCVYPSPPQSPTSIHVDAKGADGETWLSRKDTKNFSFVRPSGNPSNIPLDGKTTTMGTATWTTLPTDQTILLHIADATVCSRLYPTNTTGTCFVLPGTNPLSCTDGDDSVAYNANPFGVIHCPKSAIGFEATATNEFGDEVQVAKATTGTRLIVEFNSFGCGDSGHWFNTDCMTTPGETFTVPGGITATLYPGDTTHTGGVLASSFGTPLGSVTINPSIPFRPSVDAKCLPGTTNVPGGWFDSLAPAGSECKNSESILLTFDFSGVNLTSGQKVVWTVQFNTSHSGYSPLLLQGSPPPACPSQGCGYDSLNVGDQTYANAVLGDDLPYAGTDIDLDIAFISFYNGGYPPPFGSGTLQDLQSQIGWSDFRPLGEILQIP